MPVLVNGMEKQGSRQIYMTRHSGVDKQLLKDELAQRARAGAITERDETLLEYLRELHVLSLDQARRLLWPESGPATAYNRLNKLTGPKYQLLGHARMPVKEARGWGLAGQKAYTLGPGGWIWLKEEVNTKIVARTLKREQVLHDLLVAEVCVRFIETANKRGPDWTVTWVGEEAASLYPQREDDRVLRELDPDRHAIVAPDGLVVVARQQNEAVAKLPMFIELDKGREAHGRPSSDWGRKVNGYNKFCKGDWRRHPQLADLPEFPVVAVITHGHQRLLNLAQAIMKHRKESVAYYLALWDDLVEYGDFLSAPAWLMITPEGQVVGAERDERQPLLPES